MKTIGLALSALMAGTAAFAADLPSKTKGAVAPQQVGGNAILAVNNQVSLDLVATHYDYLETGDGLLGTPVGALDSEKGYVPGFAVSASLMRNLIVDNFYVSATYQRLSGKTDYIGSISCPGNCSYVGGANPTIAGYGSARTKNGAETTTADLRIGKGFALAGNLMITPFVGLGLYDWDRKVNRGEKYRSNYYGAGAMAQYAIDPRLVVSAAATVGRTFGSHIDVKGGSLVSILGYPAFAGSLGDSMIVKVALSADYALTDHVHLMAGVDYTTFKFGRSAVYAAPNAAWEPDSKSNLTTVKIGVGYAF